jgi:hypothetical protein
MTAIKKQKRSYGSLQKKQPLYNCMAAVFLYKNKSEFSVPYWLAESRVFTLPFEATHARFAVRSAGSRSRFAHAQ